MQLNIDRKTGVLLGVIVLLAAADESDIDHVRRGRRAFDGFEDRRHAEHKACPGEGSLEEKIAPGQTRRLGGGQSFHFPVSSSLLCFAWKSMRAMSAMWIASQATPEFSLMRMRPTVRLV